MSKQGSGAKPQSTPPSAPPPPQPDPSIISIVKKGGDKPDIIRPAQPQIERK
jgi:hypothetical protein